MHGRHSVSGQQPAKVDPNSAKSCQRKQELHKLNPLVPQTAAKPAPQEPAPQEPAPQQSKPLNWRQKKKLRLAEAAAASEATRLRAQEANLAGRERKAGQMSDKQGREKAAASTGSGRGKGKGKASMEGPAGGVWDPSMLNFTW